MQIAMKVPNLKTLDYKQLGIDHGEKLAIAIVGLLLLFVLWTTKWSQPIAKAPTELIDQAATTEEKIKKQAWPVSETKALNTGTDLNAKAVAMLSPLEFAPWALPVAMNKPYHPDRTLITKPKWLAVHDLVADAQDVDLEMDPKVARFDDGFKKLKKEDTSKAEKAKKAEQEKKDKEAEEKTEVPEDLKRTGDGGGPGSGGPGGLGGMGGGLGRGGMMGGMGRGKRGKGGDNDRIPNTGRGKGRKSRKKDDDTPVVKTDSKPVQKPIGRGYHVVSVRGIFPLREQVAELVRAMGNGITPHDAQELIQMHDFKLERQTAKPGPDPWSGPWEPVDREATFEMFRNDIYSFSPEPVSDNIIDNHICMPLPIRLIGEWGKLATHRLVKEFTLSPDEVEAQVEYQRKIIAKMQEEDKKKHKEDDTGGFAPFTRNTRKVQRRPQNPNGPDAESSKPIQQQILDDLEKAPKDRPDDVAINAKLADYIAKHASPQDHLLLFRYVDFNVEPGKFYRYRVRLEVDNPFHNRHAEEVAEPSIIERKYWDTEVSEPTKPVYVPEPAHFYVMHVVGDAGRSSLPWAKVDLYQWFASTGTVVNKELIATIGQLVGGLHLAKVLNPAENTDDTEKVPFVTNDALVDVAPGFSLIPELHKDLISEIAAAETKDKSEPQEHKASDKEKPNKGSMVPDVLVFVDGNGALRVIDGLDQQEEHQDTKNRYTIQNDQYDELTKPDEDKADQGRPGTRMGGLGKKGGRRGGRSTAGAKKQQ
jgi:hypothetical protein